MADLFEDGKDVDDDDEDGQDASRAPTDFLPRLTHNIQLLPVNKI